jgi:hypothetical protein
MYMDEARNARRYIIMYLLSILNGKTATVNNLIAFIKIYTTIYIIICTRALHVAITQYERMHWLY